MPIVLVMSALGAAISAGSKAGIIAAIAYATYAILGGRVEIRDIWGKFRSFCSSTWAFLVAAGGAIYACLTKSAEILDSTVSTIVAFVMPDTVDTSTSAFSDALSLCNRFLPLQEGFGFIIAYFAVWLILILYRFVKSWIPTLGG